MLIGFVPIKPTGPTLGTPIFRLEEEDDDGEYIQFSAREQKIEALLRLPDRVSKQRSFARVTPNSSFNLDHEFLVGFRDANNVSQAYSKKDFIAKFAREFSDYDDLPFLQWNVISCFDAIDLISKVTDKNIQLMYAAQMAALTYEFVGSNHETRWKSSFTQTLKRLFIPAAMGKYTGRRRAQYFSYNYDSLFSIQNKKIQFDEMLKLPEIVDMKFLLPTNVGNGASAADKVLRSLRQTMLKGLLESRRKIGRPKSNLTRRTSKTAKTH